MSRERRAIGVWGARPAGRALRGIQMVGHGWAQTDLLNPPWFSIKICDSGEIEELRLALLEFKRTYNEHWMLERDDYRSPAQVRRDLVGLDAAA